MAKLSCPKCQGTDVSIVGTTHYICNNPMCETQGRRTQFHLIEDDKIRFPYNQIYIGRPKRDFVRKPYLVIQSVGISESNI